MRKPKTRDTFFSSLPIWMCRTLVLKDDSRKNSSSALMPSRYKCVAKSCLRCRSCYHTSEGVTHGNWKVCQWVSLIQKSLGVRNHCFFLPPLDFPARLWMMALHHPLLLHLKKGRIKHLYHTHSHSFFNAAKYLGSLIISVWIGSLLPHSWVL